ncbi:MAG TPA: hypothetical protein VN032_10085 [Thermoanaerobaculia bacterium]|jgi:hypothetical protein|nr:hypothetical protein [Thermoanaerobaculia bacterium]
MDLKDTSNGKPPGEARVLRFRDHEPNEPASSISPELSESLNRLTPLALNFRFALEELAAEPDGVGMAALALSVCVGRYAEDAHDSETRAALEKFAATVREATADFRDFGKERR